VHNLRFEILDLKLPAVISRFYNCRESSTKRPYFLQNKANVKIGKMNISIAKLKDYDKKQRTTNNECYSKQTQTKPIFKGKSSAERRPVESLFLDF